MYPGENAVHTGTAVNAPEHWSRSSKTVLQVLDPVRYVRVLLEFKWLILLFCMAIAALAAYYVNTITPLYQASTTLLIDPQQSNVVSIKGLAGDSQPSSDNVQTQVELLRSPELARRVVRQLGLVDHPEMSQLTAQASLVDDVNDGLLSVAAARILSWFRHAPAAPIGDAEREDLVVNRVLEQLRVNPILLTELVRVQYLAQDPELAADVANAVANQYLLSYLEVRNEMTDEAATWLEQKLAELKGTLDASEARLLQFKKNNGLIAINGSVGRLDEQELMLAAQELAEAKSQLSESSNLRAEVERLRTTPELLYSLPDS